MRFVALALVFVGWVVVFPGLGRRDFWPPDEARYAGVSAEMSRSGDFAIPTLNAEVYPDKPPGYFWMVCAGAWFTGDVDEATARWPSGLGALLIVFLVGLFAARSAGPAAGFLSGLLLLSSWLFVEKARYAQLDVLFSAFIAAALLLGFDAMERGRPRQLSVALATLGPAILVKGPLALMALPVLLLWKFLGRPAPAESPRRRAVVITGLGVMLLPVAAWLAWAVSEAGLDYVTRGLLGKHTIERATRGLAHLQPWWFYLERIPVAFLPGTLLLPLWLAPSIRAAVAPEGRRLACFAALWVAVFAIFESLLPGKRSVYALVYFPALGLLAGVAASALRHEAGAPARAWGRLAVGLPAVALLAIGLTAAVAGFSTDSWVWTTGRLDAVVGDVPARFARLRLPLEADDAGLSSWLRHLRFLALPALLGSVLALVLVVRGSLRAGVEALGLGLAVTLSVLAALVMPHLDAGRSRRDLAVQVRDVTGGEPVEIFRHVDEGLLFYFRRPLPEVRPAAVTVSEKASSERAVRRREMEACEAEMVRRFDGAVRRWVLIREKDRQALTRLEEGRDYDVVLSRRVGSKRHYDLIRSRGR